MLICVLILLLYMRPLLYIYVSSYYYYICSYYYYIYVSSYYYYICSYYYYIYVSSYYYYICSYYYCIYVSSYYYYICVLSCICVRTLLLYFYVCVRTTILLPLYVSLLLSYYFFFCPADDSDLLVSQLRAELFEIKQQVAVATWELLERVVSSLGQLRLAQLLERLLAWVGFVFSQILEWFLA